MAITVGHRRLKARGKSQRGFEIAFEMWSEGVWSSTVALPRNMAAGLAGSAGARSRDHVAGKSHLAHSSRLLGVVAMDARATSFMRGTNVCRKL